MEEFVLVLTEKQMLGDKAAKVVLGGIAGLLAKTAIEKIYDAAMTAHRIKKLTES